MNFFDFLRFCGTWITRWSLRLAHFSFYLFHIMTRPPVVHRFSLSRGIDPRGRSCVKLDTDVRSTEAPGFRMPLPAVPRWSEILRHLQRIACEPVP